MNIYNFHPITGEYLSTSIADESPEDQGQFIIPGNATDVAKIANIPPLKTQIFNKTLKTWSLVDDFRNIDLFDKQTGSPIKINELGVKPDDIGATVLSQPSLLHSFIGGQWQVDQVKVAAAFNKSKSDKVNELTAAFNIVAVAGFVTSSGIKMDSSIDSIQMLKSAYDLAELLGLSSMPRVVDFNDDNHLNLPMANVLTMIMELGVNYQTLYARKQDLRAVAMAATTQAQLDAVNW